MQVGLRKMVLNPNRIREWKFELVKRAWIMVYEKKVFGDGKRPALASAMEGK